MLYHSPRKITFKKTKHQIKGKTFHKRKYPQQFIDDVARVKLFRQRLTSSINDGIL